MTDSVNKSYILILCIVLAFFVVATTAHCQVPVHTRLIDGRGNPIPQAYLQWEFKNCGNNTPVFTPMPALSVDRKFVMRPDASGIVDDQILPTDQVTCGNVASGAWTVTPMKDAQTPLQPAQTYRILSTEYSSLIPFDPTVALPMVGALPAPGFQTLFANPTKDQTVIQPTGTSMIFKGIYDFRQATVLGITADCGPGGCTGGGGIGDAVLNFAAPSQDFQGAPGATGYFTCPVGSVGSFVCFQWRKADLTNILSIAADGTITWGNGIDGTMRLARVIHSIGTTAATGFIGLAPTDLLVGFKSNDLSHENTIGQNGTDELVFNNFAGYRDEAGKYFMRTAPMTQCQPVDAVSAGVAGSTPRLINAACVAYVDPGGDVCKQLKNALADAVALGNIDVTAMGLRGDLRCATNPMHDSFQGNLFLGHQNWWLNTNAAAWTTHGRVHIIALEGRSSTGATSGTIWTQCNNDNAACNGNTYNPTAAGRCVDGAGTTVPCPMLSWSLAGENGNPSQQMFASTLEGGAFNCNSIAGSIAIRNGMFPFRTQTPACNGKCGAQEDSWIKSVRIENCGNAGEGILMLPGSSNFQVDSVNALNEQQTIADCSAFHAIDVIFDNTVVANGPKRIDNITNTNGTCTIKPVDSMLLDAGEIQVKGYHTENTTGSGIKVGSRANAIGTTLININGVGSSSTSATIRISAGNIVGLTALNTVNVNPAGYTIKDEYHGNDIRIDCQSDTAFYSFGAGVADRVLTDAPCVPTATIVSAPWITNVILAAGDVIRLVGGSTSFQVTKNSQSTNLAIKPLGIAASAVPDTVVRVPVIVKGPVGVGGIPAPVLTSGTCAAGQFVYPSNTDGQVLCATARPTNIGVLGVAIKDVASGGLPVPMYLDELEPGEGALTQCTGTGTAAANSVLTCAAHLTGAVKCAHASSAGTCEIDTTAIKATSIVNLTPDTSITTGCDVPTAPLYVSARVAGTSFTIPMQTLSGTNGMCLNYRIVNIN